MDLFKLTIVVLCAIILHKANDISKDLQLIKQHCVVIENKLTAIEISNTQATHNR